MRSEQSPVTFKATTNQKEAYRAAAAAARLRLSKWIRRTLANAIEAEAKEEAARPPERPKIEIPAGRKLCMMCSRLFRLFNRPPAENCKDCRYGPPAAP
jgi:hypothetical protein